MDRKLRDYSGIHQNVDKRGYCCVVWLNYSCKSGKTTIFSSALIVNTAEKDAIFLSQ